MRTLIVPDVSHDIHIIVNQTVSSFPTMAKVLLKMSPLSYVSQKTIECYVGLEFATPRIAAVPPLLKKLIVQRDQRKIGIKHVLQADGSLHYIMQQEPQKKITWLQAEELCTEKVNGRPLVYFSQREMKEIP